jgi:hypothetical protein
VGDETRHIHLGHMRSPHQRQLTVAEQGRCQSGAHTRGLQHAALFQTDEQGIGIVTVEHHHRCRLGLAQGICRVVLEPTHADRMHGPSSKG